MVFKYSSSPRRLLRHLQAEGCADATAAFLDPTVARADFAAAMPAISEPRPAIKMPHETTAIGALEEQLRRSEAQRARLEAILQSMDEALLVVDEAGEVVFTNEAYSRMFGGETAMHASDVMGEPLSPAAWVERHATGDAPFTTEFTVTEADGTRRWFRAHGEPTIGVGGGRQGGAVIIKDITERSLYRLQNEFVARVSHELGSPLAAIVLSLRMMLRHLPAGDARTKEVQAYTETALWEAERMRVLIGDLVDISRLQRGRLRLRLQPEDLTPLLRRAVSLVQLGTRTQTFVLEVPQMPVPVTGDATRLEQVMVNLLSNAVQHAPQSERIEVRLRTVAGEAELQVQDYGPGIASADLPHLFGRYSAVARRGSANHTGLGLGLYITKELVDAHGGHIDVESEEGHGTRFTVRLPLLERSSSSIVCTVATLPPS